MSRNSYGVTGLHVRAEDKASEFFSVESLEESEELSGRTGPPDRLQDSVDESEIESPKASFASERTVKVFD